MPQRKQELGAFLVSPLGRLSKLGLVLRRLLQITPKDHEDADQIPVVLDQIDSMLRSVRASLFAVSPPVGFHSSSVLTERLKYLQSLVLTLRQPRSNRGRWPRSSCSAGGSASISISTSRATSERYSHRGRSAEEIERSATGMAGRTFTSFFLT